MAAVTSAGYFRLRRAELEERKRETPPQRPTSVRDERLQREAQDDEGPLPDRAVRRDVGDLVNPQNPRDEEPEGEGEDDRREVERAREDEVRPEDRDRPEFDPHRNLPETVMREA